MKKLFSIFLAVMLLTAVTLPAVCRADGAWEKSQKMDMDKKLCQKMGYILQNSEELGLTEDQTGKIKDLKMNMEKDLIMKQAEIDILALDIKYQLWKDKIDLDTVNDLIDKKYDLKKAKTKAIIAAEAGLKNILTADQSAKLKGLCKEEYNKKGICGMMEREECGTCPMGKGAGMMGSEKMKMMKK